MWDDGAEFVGSTVEIDDKYGTSVAQTTNRIAVGAPFHDVGSDGNEGTVYIYEKTEEGNWLETKIIKPDIPIANEHFGTSVELFEEYLIVGAPNPSDKGRVYVFQRVNTTEWSQLTVLALAPEQDWADFGKSVTMTRTDDGALWLFVGAPESDNEEPYQCESDGDIINFNNGIVDVFRENDSEWIHHKTLHAPDCYAQSLFGYSVDASAQRVVIGSPETPTYQQQLEFSGAAYVAQYDGNSWQICTKLRSSYPEIHSRVGECVSIDNNTVIVGAPQAGDSGQVLVFSLQPTGQDCNGNGVDDSIDICSGDFQDCNENQILDVCDITNGMSEDCNGNDVPDECEIAIGDYHDCDGNGVLDVCEILLFEYLDCNLNSILDSCEIGDTLFVTFVLDGSATMLLELFELQKDAIQFVLCNSGAYDDIDLLIVSVIQFSNSALIEVGPKIFVDGVTSEAICEEIDAIQKTPSDTELDIALGFAQQQFTDVGPTISRSIVLFYGGTTGNWEDVRNQGDILRSMDPPVRISCAMVSSISNCNDVNLQELANTGNTDDTQPQGFFMCLTDTGDFTTFDTLCRDSIGHDNNDEWELITNLDCNNNQSIDSCDCDADITNGNDYIVDGDVNISDLLLVIGEWGDCPIATPCYGDITCDGTVDVMDILEVIGNWGPDCSPLGLGIPKTVQDCLNRFPLGSLQLEKCLEVVEYLQNQEN